MRKKIAIYGFFFSIASLLKVLLVFKMQNTMLYESWYIYHEWGNFFLNVIGISLLFYEFNQVVKNIHIKFLTAILLSILTFVVCMLEKILFAYQHFEFVSPNYRMVTPDLTVIFTEDTLSGELISCIESCSGIYIKFAVLTLGVCLFNIFLSLGENKGGSVLCNKKPKKRLAIFLAFLFINIIIKLSIAKWLYYVVLNNDIIFCGLILVIMFLDGVVSLLLFCEGNRCIEKTHSKVLVALAISLLSTVFIFFDNCELIYRQISYYPDCSLWKFIFDEFQISFITGKTYCVATFITILLCCLIVIIIDVLLKESTFVESEDRNG